MKKSIIYYQKIVDAEFKSFSFDITRFIKILHNFDQKKPNKNCKSEKIRIGVSYVSNLFSNHATYRIDNATGLRG